MNQSLRGMLVAAVPATLGILFGIGVIVYGLDHGHKSEEAAAQAGGDKKQQQAAGTQQTSGQSSQASGQSASGDAEIKKLVETNCAACHGADLKGAFGPSLVEAAKKYDEKQIVEILKSGKGSMPAGRAAGKEEAVAKYIKSLAK